MPIAGVVTLIAVGLVVAALAIYLIWVALLLRRVSFNLGTIVAGLWSIAFQAEPLGRRMNRINQSLDASHRTLAQFVEQKQRQSQARAGDPRGAEADNGGGSRAAGRKSTKAASRKATGRKSTGRKSTGGRR